MFCVLPPNSRVEALSPDGMALGGGAFGRFTRDQESGAQTVGLVSSEEGPPELPPSRPSEDMQEGGQQTNQEDGSLQDLPMLPPRSRSCQSQNWEK